MWLHASGELLNPGDLVLPPSETGQPANGWTPMPETGQSRRDRVYVFECGEPPPTRHCGRFGFTVSCFLYEVEPIGELWPDPAPMMAAGTVASRCCTRARVVRLVGTCPAAKPAIPARSSPAR